MEPEIQAGPIQRLVDKLFQSRFLTLSAALHLIFILAFGGTVLFHAATTQEEFDAGGGGGFLSDPGVSTPPPQPQQQQQQTPTMDTVPTQTNVSATLSPLVTQSRTEATFRLPSTARMARSPRADSLTQMPSPADARAQFSQLSPEAAQRIQQFTQDWRTGGGVGEGFGGQSRFKFTAYLARYRGGNWDSTVELERGRIVRGSLPNLMHVMTAWSRDRIDASAQPVPLDLSSDEIFEIKPPFIFMTGHQDFTLTDQEVENLRRYLMMGGAIWGDSSLPGARSRFDIAFRREMKRVIPDVDRDFERLPDDHPVFTQGFFPEIRRVPAGVNYYREPVYVLKIYDEIAVIYTANDYADMWQIGLTERGEVDTRRDERNRYVALNNNIWSNRDTYFRNINQESVNEAYKFGINMVTYLITRWETRLQRVPRL